jgi:membrane associated rhomboid family serine protease
VFRVLLTISGFREIYASIRNAVALPADLSTFITQPWSLISYMFTHAELDRGGFFHILFNMLFLYWFGRLVEDFIGSKKLVNIFVLGGLVGGITFVLIYNLIPYYSPERDFVSLVGASAGVSAIVLAAATLAPDHSFHLFLIGPVKIKYIALVWIVFKSFQGLDGSNAGGEWAHLGGALIGYLYVTQLRKGTDLGSWIGNSLDWAGNLFKDKPKIRVSHRKERAYASGSKTSQRASANAGKASQDEIDAILDKISAKGYESLSKEEKQKLFNASKKS